jgi:quinol monooxygenase YgiN
MAPIQYTITWKVAPEHLPEFKELARRTAERVQASEPKTLGYNWYVSSVDETSWTLIEQYEDSDAIVTHTDNQAAERARFLQIAQLQLAIYGDVMGVAGARLNALGAVASSRIDGFTRY